LMSGWGVVADRRSPMGTTPAGRPRPPASFDVDHGGVGAADGQGRLHAGDDGGGRQAPVHQQDLTRAWSRPVAAVAPGVVPKTLVGGRKRTGGRARAKAVARAGHPALWPAPPGSGQGPGSLRPLGCAVGGHDLGTVQASMVSAPPARPGAGRHNGPAPSTRPAHVHPGLAVHPEAV